MKRPIKKVMALAMSLLMVVSAFPFGTFADNLELSEDVVEITEEVPENEATEDVAIEESAEDVISDEVEEPVADETEEVSETTEADAIAEDKVEEAVLEDVAEEHSEEEVSETQEEIEENLEEPAEIEEVDEAKEVSEVVEEAEEAEEVATGEAEKAVEEEITIDVPSGLNWDSMRLLVGTDDESLVEDAIASFNDVYILQFNTVEDAQKAYTVLKDKVEFIELDTGISIAEGEDAEVVNTDTVMTEKENPFSELEDISVNGKFDIALIDTGANTDKAVSVIGDSVLDDNSHGTSMLEYIKGENPDAKILSIKALNSDGKGDVSSVYAAIQLAIENNVKVINLSISAMAGKDSYLIEDAINDAVSRGIIVVGAAGNNGSNAKFYVPGGIEMATIIGAADERGVRIEASNYGETVDYNVVAKSTSEAAAKFSGYISKGEIALNEGLVFEPDFEGLDLEKVEEDTEEFHTASNFVATLTGGSPLKSVGTRQGKDFFENLVSINLYGGFDENSTTLSGDSWRKSVTTMGDGTEYPEYTKAFTTDTSLSTTILYPSYLKKGNKYYDVEMKVTKVNSEAQGEIGIYRKRIGFEFLYGNNQEQSERIYDHTVLDRTPGGQEIVFSLQLYEAGTKTPAKIDDIYLELHDIDGRDNSKEAVTIVGFSANSSNTFYSDETAETIYFNNGTFRGVQESDGYDSMVIVPSLRNSGNINMAYGGYTFNDTSTVTYGAFFRFYCPTYEVKYKASTGGKITGDSSEMLFSEANPSGSSYTSNNGYKFKNWTTDQAVTLEDGTKIAANQTITAAQIKQVVMPSKDISFTANFEPDVHKITTSATNGTITPTDNSVADGANKTISYSPNTGYKLKSVTVDGTAVNISTYPSSYTFSNVKADHDIKVVYEKIKYNITTAVEGGTIDASTTVEHGDSKTINFKPNSGYRLYSVTVDGTAQNITSNPTKWNFNNVTANHNIKVVYKPNPKYEVTKTTPKDTYNVDETVKYTIKIKQTVQDAFPENVTLTDNEITAGMNIVSSSVKASKGTATLSNNALTWKGTLGYNEEVTITYDAKPNQSTYSSATASNKAAIKGDTTGISATTTKVVNEQVNIVTTVKNGTITPTENNIPVGQNRTITFKPDEGFFLKSLKVDGTDQDLSKRNIYAQDTYVFNGLKSNHKVDAVYARIPVYTITKVVDQNKPNYNISETIRYTIVASQIWPDAEPETATITDDGITAGVEIQEGTVEVNYGTIALENNMITWHGTIDNANPVVITYDAKPIIGEFANKTADNTATVQGDFHKRPKSAEVKKPITVNVVTKIVPNGEITESEYEIPMLEDRTISYTPEEGRYVKKVTLDDNELPRTPHLESVDLNVLVDNHEVVVETAPIPELEITKKADHDKVYKFGDTIKYTVNVKNVREGSETEGLYIEDLGMDYFDIDVETVKIAEWEDSEYEVVRTEKGFKINAPNKNLAYNEEITVTYDSIVMEIPDGVNASENTVMAKSHPDNEPPYDDSVTDTEKVDIVVKVTTEIVNGNITPSNEEVVVGTTPEVKWAPDDKYYVKEIEIDGKPVDRNDFDGETNFPDIQGDHHVKVVCAKIPVLEIEKEASSETIYKFGETIKYTVKVTNVEEDSITEGLYIEDTGIEYLDILMDSIKIEGMDGEFDISVREEAKEEAKNEATEESKDEAAESTEEATEVEDSNNEATEENSETAENADSNNEVAEENTDANAEDANNVATTEPEKTLPETDGGKGFVITSKEGLEYGKTLTITYEATVREIPDEVSELKNVVLAKSNPEFKPPYDDEVKTDKTIDVVVKVTTSIEGGTITPTNDKVKVGTDPKVEWKPFDGYYVKEIWVDGVLMNRDDFKDMTEFLNIQKDHDVKVICAPIPKLELEKVSDKERVERDSDKITYTINITNVVENSITEGLYIEDTGVKVGKIDFDSLAVSLNTEAGIAVWTLEDYELEKTEHGFVITSDKGLAYGDTIVITYDVEVSDIEDSIKDFTNEALAKSNPKFNPPYDDEAKDDKNVFVNDPELVIAKTVSEKEVKLGDTVYYAVAIKETIEKMEATNVIFSDTSEDGIEIDLSTIKLNGEPIKEVTLADVTDGAHTFSFTIDSIKYGDEIMITYEGIAKEDGEFKNVAIATSDQTPEPVESEANVIVKNEPKLEITKKADKETAKIGDKISYTITVKQVVENMYASNVVITDNYDSGMEIDFSSIKMNGKKVDVATEGNSFSINIEKLEYDEEVVATYEATAKKAGKLKNTAAVTSDQNKTPEKAEVTVKVDDPVKPIKTGDNSNIYLYGVMSISAFLAAILMYVRRRLA